MYKPFFFIFIFLCAASTWALSKETVVDRMEVLSSGHVQVRLAHQVFDGGQLIAQTFERYVVSPGDDYSSKPNKVQDVCKKVHTPARIKAFNDSQKPGHQPDTPPGLAKVQETGKVYILEDDTMLIEDVTMVYDNGKVIGQSEKVRRVEKDADMTKESLLVRDARSAMSSKVTEDLVR